MPFIFIGSSLTRCRLINCLQASHQPRQRTVLHQDSLTSFSPRLCISFFGYDATHHASVSPTGSGNITISGSDSLSTISTSFPSLRIVAGVIKSSMTPANVHVILYRNGVLYAGVPFCGMAPQYSNSFSTLSNFLAAYPCNT